MTHVSAATLSTVVTKADEWKVQLAFPVEPVVTNLKIRLQDPTPDYELYLPERFFNASAVTAEWGAGILYVHCDDSYESLFPNVQNPVHCLGQYEFDWEPAS